MKRRVAIFDIDGTIFRSSLLIELVDALIEEGIFPASAAKVYARAYQRWLDRKDSYDKYLDAVVRAFIRHREGVRYKDFLRVSKKVSSFHKNRVYRYTRDLVCDLKRRGYYLIAISNSPRTIVDAFCRKLGFRKVYGRIYEVDARGRLTSHVLYEELVRDKAKILTRAVLKEGLTLKKSIGVGDSESDIPFLKMVARPICFNPNRKLYQYAKRHKWEVVVERKDMIYIL